MLQNPLRFMTTACACQGSRYIARHRIDGNRCFRARKRCSVRANRIDSGLPLSRNSACDRTAEGSLNQLAVIKFKALSIRIRMPCPCTHLLLGTLIEKLRRSSYIWSSGTPPHQLALGHRCSNSARRPRQRQIVCLRTVVDIFVVVFFQTFSMVASCSVSCSTSTLSNPAVCSAEV